MRYFLFLFLPLTAFPDFYLSICSIFRDEAPYFKEWIEFHKLQGVEHFYLYNNNSEDDYLKALQPYVNAGEVTLIDWPYQYQPGVPDGWLAIQRGAYMHCISTYGKTTDWLAVIDLDEFLFSPSGKALPQILINYEEYGGVCANWRMFGTSDVDSIPPGGLMIEFLTHCNLPDQSINRRIKSIVRPDRVLNCENVHYFIYKNDFYSVDTNKIKTFFENSSEPRYDQLQINHYWTRTKNDFLNRKIKSRINRRLYRNFEGISNRANMYNLDSDFSILQFVRDLKCRMEF